MGAAAKPPKQRGSQSQPATAAGGKHADAAAGGRKRAFPWANGAAGGKANGAGAAAKPPSGAPAARTPPAAKPSGQQASTQGPPKAKLAAVKDQAPATANGSHAPGGALPRIRPAPGSEPAAAVVAAAGAAKTPQADAPTDAVDAGRAAKKSRLSNGKAQPHQPAQQTQPAQPQQKQQAHKNQPPQQQQQGQQEGHKPTQQQQDPLIQKKKQKQSPKQQQRDRKLKQQQKQQQQQGSGPVHPAAAGAAGAAAAGDGGKAAAAGPAGAVGPAVGAGSNWAALRARIGATGEGAKLRAAGEAAAGRKPSSMGSNTGVTPIVALDCEMVGVGPDGVRSALARVAVVNQEGNLLLDLFVKPKERVTDFRTQFSGVRPHDLSGPNAVELEAAQAQVAALIQGRMLVGHSLHNDMNVLLLDHPRKDTRDTARYPPLMRLPAPGKRPQPRALRHLALEQLGLDIQGGEHSPVDDARAALYIYLRHRKEWEAAITNGTLRRNTQAIKQARRDALSAATAAATAAGGGAAGAGAAGAGGPAGALAAARQVLSAAQLRALRTGRSLKKVAGKRTGVAAGGAGGAAGVSAGVAAGAGGKVAGVAALMVHDAEEMRELVTRAAKEGARAGGAGGAGGTGTAAGSKRRRTMQEVLTRDVRSDPMADL